MDTAPSVGVKRLEAVTDVSKRDGTKFWVELKYSNTTGRPLCIAQLNTPGEDGGVHYNPFAVVDETGRELSFIGFVLDVSQPSIGYDIIPPTAKVSYNYDLSSHYDLARGHTYRFEIVVPAVDCAVFETGYAFPAGGSLKEWEEVTGQPAANTDGKRYVIETGKLTLPIP